MDENELTEKIIGSAIEVHRLLGPGLLESTYEECLCYELIHQNVPFEKQKDFPISYKELYLDCGYRLDVLVSNLVVVEIKAVSSILPVHQAQILTYMKLGGWKVGLLLNFNVIKMTDGIKRMVLNFNDKGRIPPTHKEP